MLIVLPNSAVYLSDSTSVFEVLELICGERIQAVSRLHFVLCWMLLLALEVAEQR